MPSMIGQTTRLRHPSGCLPQLCTCTDPLTRDHRAVTSHLLLAWGTTLTVGIAEPVESQRGLQVMIVSETPGVQHLENLEYLEPEEARLLARRLLEAADAADTPRA